MPDTSISKVNPEEPQTAKPSSNGVGSYLPVTLRSLQHRNFQLFFSGQLISLTGTWMQIIAESWLVYRLTGSSLLLGTAGFCSQFPVFLVAPIGGIVADRHNRQRVVIGTQVASMVLALTLATLTLTHVVRVWEISSRWRLCWEWSNAFDIPARQAFLVDMVGKEHLMNAIALNSSMFSMRPALSARRLREFLLRKSVKGWCFFSNGVSYIAVIIGLMMMRVASPARLATSAASPLTHILEGFPLRTKHAADSDDTAFAGAGEFGGDAVCRAHAHFSPTAFCTGARADSGFSWAQPAWEPYWVL